MTGLTPRLERALADVVGGYGGGWHFWQAAIAALEEALADARHSESSFRSFPPAPFRRLLVAVDDALRMAAAAVAVQQALDEDDDGKRADRERDIAEVLLARARELERDRTH